jgi:hypothetical protein
MKTARFSDAQIMGILRQAESGVPVSELCRGQGIDQILAFFVGRGRFNFNLNQRFPLCAFLRRGSIRGDLGG